MIKKHFLLVCTTASIALFISGLVYGYLSGFNSTSPSKINVDLSGGQYIRLVFVGSSTCGYSNNDVTTSLIKNIKADLKNLSNSHDFGFISTGISYDVSSKVALEYLEKTGDYNELLVGNGPFNLGTIQYTSGKSPTPLILLFAENYETDLSGMNMNNFNSSQEHIGTLSGQYEIQEFHDFLVAASDDEVLEYFEMGM